MRWKTGPGLEVVIVRGPLEERCAAPIPGITPLLAESEAPLPTVEQNEPVNLRLSRPRYVGEIGTGGLEGPTTRFMTSKGMWWPALLVLSDRPLEAPRLAVARRSVSRGDFIHLQATIPDFAGWHAVKMRERGPDGTSAPWFDCSVTVREGYLAVTLPVALNEQIGTWTITGTDLYTDLNSAVTVEVE